MYSHESFSRQQDEGFLRRIGSAIKGLIHHEPYSLEAADARLLQVAQEHGRSAFSTSGDATGMYFPADLRNLPDDLEARVRAQAAFEPRFMPAQHRPFSR